MSAKPESSYRNFRDLRGLLLRLLRSGNRAAYATLFHESLAKLAVPFDLLLVPWERRRIAAAPPSELPVILIVGMPRAGTTLVSQVLSRYLDVAFLNNLTAVFPRSPITASRIFAGLLDDRKPNFTSYYGNTPRLAGPNEGFPIWNRWLGSDRYHAASTLDPEERHEMRQFFDAWLSTFQKPFLNKSVRNIDAISVLASTLRNPYFVCVRRDLQMVVQSLILSRQHVQGGKGFAWGLYSREEAIHSDPLGYVDDVCRQVIEMEEQLKRSQDELGPKRFLNVPYEAFCHDPAQAVRTVASFAADVQVREERLQKELQPFRPSTQLRLTDQEVARMEQILQGKPHPPTSES